MHSSNAALLCIMIFLAGCGSMKDDLLPRGTDKRPAVLQGTIGPSVGQQAPDFTLPDTLGNPVLLSGILPQNKGIVLYFTMWCPACDSHMSHMRDSVIPQNSEVRFLAVDYVSGSVAASRDAQVSNGYADSGFTVLADAAQSVLHSYNATMGTTVVIDRNGTVHMNEDFKDGVKLQNVLAGLP